MTIIAHMNSKLDYLPKISTDDEHEFLINQRFFKPNSDISSLIGFRPVDVNDIIIAFKSPSVLLTPHDIAPIEIDIRVMRSHNITIVLIR